METNEEIIRRVCGYKQWETLLDDDEISISEVRECMVAIRDEYENRKNYCMECGKDITHTRYALICEHCRIQI